MHGYVLCNEYWHRYGKVHSCFNSLQAAEVIFLDNSQESLEIYKNVKSFVRAMPDNFKLDNTISDIEAYQRYVASKPWAQHNYLRIPNRKPLWMINYAG